MRDVSASRNSRPVRGSKRLSPAMVHSVVTGQGNVLSRKTKAAEERKKRRLILEDSESEDYLVSLRQQDSETEEYGSVACFPKNSAEVAVNAKNVSRSENHVMLGMEKKRTHDVSLEDADDSVLNEKARLESLDMGKDRKDESDNLNATLDSVRFGIGKALIRASRSPCPGKASDDDQCASSSPKTLKTMKAGVYSSDSIQVSVSCRERHIVDRENISVIEEALLYDVTSNDQGLISFPIQQADAKEGSSSIDDTRSTKKPQSSESDETRSPKNSDSSKRKAPNRYFLSENQKTPKKAMLNMEKSNGLDKLFAIRASQETCCTKMPDDADQDLLFFQGRNYYKKPSSSSVVNEVRRNPRNSSCAERKIQMRHLLAEERETSRKKGTAPSRDDVYGSSSLSSSPSLSEDQKHFKKPSHLKLQKSKVQPSKLSSSEKSLVLDSTDMHDPPSQMESDDKDKLHDTVHSGKEACKFEAKVCLSSKSGALSGSISRRTEKQALRDQIKDLLVHAGWKIDMRPRKGRNYDDSVYISPEGSGYWSITKAYSVFQEQIRKTDDPDNKDAKEEFPSSSSDLMNQCSAIPMDMLGMLKRKTKKNKKMDGAESSSGNEKTKCVTSSKSAKIKKVVAMKKEISETGVVAAKIKKVVAVKKEINETGVAAAKIKKVVAMKKEINETGVVGSNRKKKKNRRGYALLARNANKEADSGGDSYVPYAGRRSILSWLIDSGNVPLNGKVKYMNKRRTKVMLEGLITRDGILCKCCSKIVTVSKFEIHAGSKMKQPFENIFLQGSGVSLLQCQVDAWNSQDESKRVAIQMVSVTEDDPNDDTCAICGDGGNLICCDSCPGTFHLSCLGIQTPPPGDWHCMNCFCKFCGQSSGSTSEGCCDSSLLSCEQCGGKYHEVCRSDVDGTLVDTHCSGLSFCVKSCKTIFELLQSRIGVRVDMEGGFSWTLVRRFYDDSLESSSGLALKAECNSKVAVALSVMDECFLPIFDLRSGINLIPNVLYNCGSNFRRLDYRGFYTFTLEQGDEILSAASVRVHGKMLAEMPFIGTRHIYRRRGMCRRLLNAIEEALGALKIEKLVIPAIPDLLHTWTSAFGFEPLSDSDYQEVRNLNMLVFPGTGLLKKRLLIPQEAAICTGSPTLREELKVNGSTFSPLHGSDPLPFDIHFQSQMGEFEFKLNGGDHAVENQSQDETVPVLADSSNKSGDGCEGNFGPISDMQMIQDICSKNDQGCKLADSAAGADCCA